MIINSIKKLNDSQYYLRYCTVSFIWPVVLDLNVDVALVDLDYPQLYKTIDNNKLFNLNDSGIVNNKYFGKNLGIIVFKMKRSIRSQ